MNLGAMLHLLGKLDEAESCHEAALRMDPGNRAAQDNLRRVRNAIRANQAKAHQSRQRGNHP